MKTKRVLAMLLIMILTVTVFGTFAGCNSADGEPDKKVESEQGEMDAGKTGTDAEATATPVPTATPELTATPEPTSTPVPTPTPEVLPTVAELFAANEDMSVDNRKTTMEMAYTAMNGTEEVQVSAKFVEEVYENVSHKKQEMVATMMGQSQRMMDDIYYVDEEATGQRTEYFYHVAERKWTKSQYAYTAPEEDKEEEEEDGEGGSALRRMVNTQVTRDGDFYYLIGDMSNEDVSELTDVMSGMGLSADFVVCEMKFDANTKKFLSAVITVKLEEGQTTIDGVGMSMETFVATIEGLSEPIVIPQEALAAELA